MATTDDIERRKHIITKFGRPEDAKRSISTQYHRAKLRCVEHYGLRPEMTGEELDALHHDLAVKYRAAVEAYYSGRCSFWDVEELRVAMNVSGLAALEAKIGRGSPRSMPRQLGLFER